MLQSNREEEPTLRVPQSALQLRIGNPDLGVAASRPLILWILLVAFLQCAGWILSGLNALNVAGYTVTLLLIAGALGWIWKALPGPVLPAPVLNRRGRLWRRFRRPFPLAFLTLAFLAILGGVIYAPNNYDGLAYRIPRILHWIAAEEWHWIPSEFSRVNTRAAGWEWVAAPLLLFTQSLRGLFLLSVIPFLFLPGLIYSTFIRLGIRRRVAWYWMWLLPCGYCFLLQAGSIGNELFGIFFALAALNFALRARVSGRVSDVWIAGLSTALLTASKAANLVLLLPLAIALFPSLRLLLRRPVVSVAVVLCAVGASLLPITLINFKYSGDAFGVNAGDGSGETEVKDPAIRIPANIVLFTIQNFAPPIFPLSEKWNAWVKETMPENIALRMKASFEPGAAGFKLEPMTSEEGAGLGLGVSGLLALSVFAGAFLRGGASRTQAIDWSRRLLLASPWVALAVIFHKSGLTALARIMAPIYSLLIPVFLLGGGQALLVRKRWWQVAAFSTFLLALLPLVGSPARPLWPANTLISKFDNSNPLIKRAQSVYGVYASRSSGFKSVASYLPPDVLILGFISMDDPETSLWFPMGSRRIIHVTHDANVEDLRRKGVEYILVSPRNIPAIPQGSQKWIEEKGLIPVTEIPLTLRAGEGTRNWFLVKLPPAP